QGEAPVSEAESAAVPVVDGLDACVLESLVDQVVTTVCGDIEARGIGSAIFEEGLKLLALNEGGSAAFFVDGVQQRMTDADGGAAAAVSGEDVVGVEAPRLRVVVHIPL